MVAMVTPYRHPKTQMYWIRKGIPVKLRPHFGGKVEFKQSLGTKDAAEAKNLASVWVTAHDRLLLEAKGGYRPLTPQDIPKLSQQWLVEALRADEDERQKNWSTNEDDSAEVNTQVSEDAPYSFELGELADVNTAREKEDWVLHEIKDTLLKNGIALPQQDTPAYKHLLDSFIRVRKDYYDTLIKRYHFGLAEAPTPELAKDQQVHNSQGENLLDVFEMWIRESEPRQKTADEYKKTAYEFYEVVGQIPVTGIKAEHIKKYLDYLRGKGSLESATISKKHGVIKTLLNIAKTNLLIEHNPAEGFRIKKSKDKKERLPFTSNDIDLIFSSPVFTQKKRYRGGAKEAAYWIPILAYYTGARLEELGQMLRSDIQEHEGIAYIEIMESNGDLTKSVKSKAGKRIIPIHPDLIELGFLKYVGKQKSNGRVFPALTPDSKGSLTQKYSKWFGRYLNDVVGIDNDQKVFHSFRHTFAQLWKESDASLDMKDAVMGHSPNTVQARYGGWEAPSGRRYPANPEQLVREIIKIKFTAKL